MQDSLIPLVAVIGILVSFFFLLALPMIPALAMGPEGKPYVPWAAAAGYALAGWILFQMTRDRFPAVGSVGVSSASLAWVSVTTLGMTAAGFALGLLAYHYVPGCRHWPPPSYSGLGGVLAGVLMAPLVEEFVFRGMILRRLLECYRPWTAIVITAGLFALVHGFPVKFPHIFLHGLLWGWCFWKTRSLWLGVAGHLANNGSAFLLDWFAPAPDSPVSWGPMVLALMLLVGGVMAAVGCFGLRRALRREGRGWRLVRAKEARPMTWSAA